MLLSPSWLNVFIAFEVPCPERQFLIVILGIWGYQGIFWMVSSVLLVPRILLEYYEYIQLLNII